MRRTAADKPLKVGGQALADGVLMRTSRAWAIARADGSLEVGVLAPNHAAHIPVLRVILGLGGALRLAIARGMLRRGSSGDGVARSRRLNKRFLWIMAAVEVVTAVVQRFSSGASVPAPFGLVPVVAAFAVTLAALRLATPAALWRYHGAEHKAVAAFEAGIDVRDTDAVLACPRVHNRCGTNLVFLMLVGGMLLMHLPALIQIPAFVVLLAAIAEVISVAAGRPGLLPSRILLGGGRALQRWVTTAEPTAAEQAVGCAALAAAVAAHLDLESAEHPDQPIATVLAA